MAGKIRVQMIQGRNYTHGNKRFTRFAEDGVTPMIYEVGQRMAHELLNYTTPRGMPVFRLAEGERAPETIRRAPPRRKAVVVREDGTRTDLLEEQAGEEYDDEDFDEEDEDEGLEDDENEDDETGDEEVEPETPPVVVRKKRTKKKAARKKKAVKKKSGRPRRMTTSEEGDDGTAEEV